MEMKEGKGSGRKEGKRRIKRERKEKGELI
jgi:hypothetical protein